jgi:hypothetical protein
MRLAHTKGSTETETSFQTFETLNVAPKLNRMSFAAEFPKTSYWNPMQSFRGTFQSRNQFGVRLAESDRRIASYFSYPEVVQPPELFRISPKLVGSEWGQPHDVQGRSSI